MLALRIQKKPLQTFCPGGVRFGLDTERSGVSILKLGLKPPPQQLIKGPSEHTMSTPPSSGVSFHPDDLIDEPLTVEDIELFLFESRYNAQLWNSAAAENIDDTPPPPPPRDVSAVPVSSFRTRFETLPDATFTVAQWLGFIRNGQAADHVAKIRASRGSPEYGQLKKKLRTVAWAGTFGEGRKATDPVNPSGLVFLELDHHDGAPPPSWLWAEKMRLASHPSTVTVYVSTGGAGLHVVSAVDPVPTSPTEYSEAWAWLTRELAIEASGDPQVKNRNRLAGISHDEAAYVNLNPTPTRWEPTLGSTGKESERTHTPETLLEAFRLIAEHFGVEWSGSSDDDCRAGLRMPCTFHGSNNPTSLSIRLEEREIAGRRGATKMVAFVAATCFSRGCYGPSVLRYIAKKVGFAWPLPIAGGEAVVEEFLGANAHRLVVVDRAKLYVRREAGLWVDGTRPSPTGTAAIQGMLKEMGCDGAWNLRQIDDLRSSLFHVMERPGHYGVAAVRSDDFDRTPLFPLRGGGSIDARTLKILDNDETAGAYMLDQSSPGIDYRPELLNAGPDHPGMRLALHFEPDPSNPRFQLLRRFGYLLLGPIKSVDCAILPVSDSGKSTLARWVSFGFPGYVSLLDSVVALSVQGTRFTVVQHRLATYKLVFLDECDKIEKSPSAGAFNALTADTLTIEQKGRDAIEAPRRGNAVMIGAGPPNLVVSQLGFGICLRKGPIELSCLVGSVDGGGGSDGQGQIRCAAGVGTTGRTPASDSGWETPGPSHRQGPDSPQERRRLAGFPSG